MVWQGKYVTRAAFLLLLIMFTSCSMLRSPDASRNAEPVVRGAASTDTIRESCIRSCNQDHGICNQGPEQRSEAFDAPKQILGSGAACDQSLRDCMKNCR